MKLIRINGEPSGRATLEQIKDKYPGAKIYESPFIISIIITKCQ